MTGTYTFNSNGKLFSVNARDMDRARVAAKKLSGPDWTGKARLVKFSNSI